MATHNFPSELSLVVPIYNEADRIKAGLSIIKQYYNRFPKWEIIFVNDGSQDTTLQLVSESTTSLKRVRIISYTKNHGKGYALKKGILAARKKLILFTDIDFSTPLSQLELLYPFVKKGADITIGTRKVKGAVLMQRQGKVREWLGQRFTAITNAWLNLEYSDYTCGFKLFKAPAAKKVFQQLTVERWGFDAEALFLANNLRLQVVEVPVVWKNDERSKVKVSTDILRSLKDLWSIKTNAWSGKYNSR